MAEQTYKNHTRMDPPFHFVILPVLLMDVLVAGYTAIHAAPGFHALTLWWIVMAVVLLLMAGTLRSQTLRVQDRIIRLEERARLAALLSQTELAQVQDLSIRQLVALRFASDAELPTLALRAAREHLGTKDIKQAIVTWRPDTYRA